MAWPNLLGIAFGLAMDALAVAVAAGLVLPAVTARHVFRLAFHFGFFQFMMPVLGWAAGIHLHHYIARWDHWCAFVLLAFVGGKMLLEACRKTRDQLRGDPTRGWLLVTLAVATSLDALAVGFSLAFLRVSVWSPSVVIGIVAATVTMVGICFGSKIGARFGRLAEAAGGAMLMSIGGIVLWSHMA